MPEMWEFRQEREGILPPKEGNQYLITAQRFPASAPEKKSFGILPLEPRGDSGTPWRWKVGILLPTAPVGRENLFSVGEKSVSQRGKKEGINSSWIPWSVFFPW